MSSGWSFIMGPGGSRSLSRSTYLEHQIINHHRLTAEVARMPHLHRAVYVVRYTMKLLLFILMLFLVSCKSKVEKSLPDNIDQLSQWLLSNETEMFRELKAIVDTTYLCTSCDTNFISKGFRAEDSATVYGTFQSKLQGIIPDIEVTYNYEKSDTNRLRIELAHEDKRRVYNAIDTILTLPVYRHFYIVKYEPPVNENTLYQLEHTMIDVRKMRFKVIRRTRRHDVTIYVQDTLQQVRLQELQELELGKKIFGEEAFVRKIGKINYEILPHLPDTLLRFSDAQMLIRK